MNGENKWEEAWRAFDAEIQLAHDLNSIFGKGNDSKEVFDSIAEEYGVTSTSISKKIESSNQYEKAWRRLGAWIYRNETTLEQTMDRYREIIDELELKDYTWSEIGEE